VLDSYLRLSQGLLAGLERLGLRVAKAPPSNRANADAGPVCFEVPSAYEIVVPARRSSSAAYRDPSSAAYRDPSSAAYRDPSSAAYRDPKKLVGSAQSRRQGWVLQHGTLPLVGDVTRLVDVVVFPGEAERAAQRQLLAQRAATVEDALGRTVSFEEAAEALAAGFEAALGIRLEVGELTPGEVAAAGELRRSVYGHETWTGRH
jgi:lipoate-protein ligase A